MVKMVTSNIENHDKEGGREKGGRRQFKKKSVSLQERKGSLF